MKLTLRSAGAAGSTDTAAMPCGSYPSRLGERGKGKRHDFHAVESLDRSTSSRNVFPFTWKKAHSASFEPRALTRTSRSDSLDQAKLNAGTSKPLNLQVLARRLVCSILHRPSPDLNFAWLVAALPARSCCSLWRRALRSASPSAAEASVGGIMNSHCPSGLKEAKPGCTIC